MSQIAKSACLFAQLENFKFNAFGPKLINNLFLRQTVKLKLIFATTFFQEKKPSSTHKKTYTIHEIQLLGFSLLLFYVRGHIKQNFLDESKLKNRPFVSPYKIKKHPDTNMRFSNIKFQQL